MKAEIERRASLADKLEALLRSRPTEWISMRELAEVGGIGGFRTRLSELARRKENPMHIEHNGKNGAASCHRFLPWEPLGRPGEARLAQPQLFDVFRRNG